VVSENAKPQKSRTALEGKRFCGRVKERSKVAVETEKGHFFLLVERCNTIHLFTLVLIYRYQLVSMSPHTVKSGHL
jgi:hypothetical protein